MAILLYSVPFIQNKKFAEVLEGADGGCMLMCLVSVYM